MRTFLLILLGAFLALNLVGLFLNPRLEVSERRFVRAPAERLHPLLEDLDRWPQWNPLFDQKLVGQRAIEWGESHRGLGARLRASFSGDAQVLYTVIASDPARGVEIETLSGRKDVDLWAGQGFRAVDAITFDAQPGGTWVSWSRRGEPIRFPLLRCADALLFRRVVRGQLVRGLEALARLAEAPESAPPATVLEPAGGSAAER